MRHHPAAQAARPLPRRRDHAVHGPTGLRSRQMAIAASIATGIMLWLVISHSLAAYLASSAPTVALWFDRSQPVALVRLADAGLLASATSDAAPAPAAGTSVDPRTYDPVGLTSIRDLAERALASDPLNSDAMRILADVAALAGDSASERQWLEAAAAGSLHQSGPRYRLMLADLARGDIEAVLTHADILMRTRPDAMHSVVAALAPVLPHAPLREALLARLKRDPPWRRDFLSRLPAHIDDARSPLELYLGLKGSSAPPTVAEQKSYLDFLVARGFYELAYYTWLQLLPPARLSTVGLLHNGDFTDPPSGLPFDWSINAGSGAIVETVAAPGDNGRRGLHVELGGGRVDLGGVEQWTMLPPGSYRLHGRMQGHVKGSRGLVWRVVCGPDRSAPIAQSPMLVGDMPEWRTFEVRFTVPATACGAQIVRLELAARSESERLVTGSAWFESVAIGRLTAAAQAVPGGNVVASSKVAPAAARSRAATAGGPADDRAGPPAGLKGGR